MSYRIGQGLDAHQAKEGNQILLGGVAIDAPFALKGYSDADVLLHAITDAILGALAEKDIGHFFPPGEEKNKKRASKDFLLFAWNLARKKGFLLTNLDCTIVCERPKIDPHRDAIRKNIAMCMEVDMDRIGIKATTTEGLGFTGREEGIFASAVILLKKENLP